MGWSRALVVASLGLAGCRAIWGLGSEPAGLEGSATAGDGAGAGDADGVGGADRGGGGGSSASWGASTATGGGASGGHGPTGAGPCGGCDADGDCGDVPGGGRCGADGRCARAAWSVSHDARGFGDAFGASTERVALVVDEGVADVVDAPRRDNRIVVLDRRSGVLAKSPLSATSIGSIAVGPSLIAYAPRAMEEDGAALLLRVDPDGSTAPWQGAPTELLLRGVHWDDDVGGFLAIRGGASGDALVRFGAEPLDACEASLELPTLGDLLVKSDDVVRFLLGADGEPTLGTLTLSPTVCPASGPLEVETWTLGTGTPVALATRGGAVAALLEIGVSTRLVVADEAGTVLLDEATTGGHALAAGPRGFYAMREGAFARFTEGDPLAFEAIDALAGASVVDVVVRDDVLFAATLDSNGEAELVCVSDP